MKSIKGTIRRPIAPKKKKPSLLVIAEKLSRKWQKLFNLCEEVEQLVFTRSFSIWTSRRSRWNYSFLSHFLKQFFKLIYCILNFSWNNIGNEALFGSWNWGMGIVVIFLPKQFSYLWSFFTWESFLVRNFNPQIVGFEKSTKLVNFQKIFQLCVW